MSDDNFALVAINAEADGPFSVIGDCVVVLGVMLAMESAQVLDIGQRHQIREATERLEAVMDELSEESPSSMGRLEVIDVDQQGEDRRYRYQCTTCSDTIEAPSPADRLFVTPHPDGGFMHYVGSTLEQCGPMRLVEEAEIEQREVYSESTCEFCEPTAGVTFNPRDQHVACALRSTLGGIGHLMDHAYWCGERGDPDAGLSYRESALFVAEWVQAHGIDAAVSLREIEETS